MSKYTTQLRWIVESTQEKVPYTTQTRYSPATYKKLGLNEYPIFDESYRKVLNDKIIDHFYFREIGFETVAQFSWYMRRTMNEIMPYYNVLYSAELDIDNPLSNYSKNWRETWDNIIHDDGNVNSERNDNAKETSEKRRNRDDVTTSEETTNSSSTGKTTSDGKTDNKNIYSDTPMSLLENGTSPNIYNGDYATNASIDMGNTHDAGTSSATNSGKTNEHVSREIEDVDKTDSNSHSNRTLEETNENTRNDSGWRERNETGRNKSQMELFNELKDKYLNIDIEIMHRLEKLFMGLW